MCDHSENRPGSQRSESVGIFWKVPDTKGDTLLVDREALVAGEVYGEFITHPRGHYEMWENWRRLSAPALRALGLPTAILYSEYEDYPRGRVVYHQPDRTFWIYADRRLQTSAFVADVKAAFGLINSPCRVLSDSHYR